MGKRQKSTSTTFFSSVLDTLSLVVYAFLSLLYQVTLPLTQHIFSRYAILLIFSRKRPSDLLYPRPLTKSSQRCLQEAIGADTAGRRYQDQQG